MGKVARLHTATQKQNNKLRKFDASLNLMHTCRSVNCVEPMLGIGGVGVCVWASPVEDGAPETGTTVQCDQTIRYNLRITTPTGSTEFPAAASSDGCNGQNTQMLMEISHTHTHTHTASTQNAVTS